MAILTALTAFATLLTAAAMTGVFFAFSVSVMPGLDATEAGQAVETMQRINEKILNPPFLTAFVGVPVAAAATAVFLMLDGHGGAGVTFLAAAAAYTAGALLPTAAINVPMNETLAAAGAPGDVAEAARLWADYSPRWTRWNTLRAAFSGSCLLLAGLGLYLWGRASS